MLLYLVQHAEAKREEEDPARGLTDKGWKDIRRVAGYAGNLGFKIITIYHICPTWRGSRHFFSAEIKKKKS